MDGKKQTHSRIRIMTLEVIIVLLAFYWARRLA